jgi:predicted phage terminase large subunit-like protein
MIKDLNGRYASHREVLDAILRTNFYSFVQASYPIISPGEPFMPNWHIEAMTHALERVLRGETRRLLIMVPPRSLKSICTSVALTAFALGQDPTQRIICASYSEGLAKKHANDFRVVMRAPFYRRIFPETVISASKDTELEAMTTKRGFRYTTSVGGTLTGRGGRLLIVDDPMKPQDAHSAAARETVQQWYSNTLLPRLDSKADGAIIVVMQRLHEDDLAAHLLQQANWEVLKLPAIAVMEQTVPLGFGRKYHRKKDEVLHPAREPLSTLLELEREMGSADFAAQYQQEPLPPGGNLIKPSWLRVYDDPPPWDHGDKLIVSWDTAMSAGDRCDYSACLILQVKKEAAYVLEVVRERLDYPDLRRKMIELHRKWSSVPLNYALLIENKGSGMSLLQDLRSEGIFGIGVKPTGDKILRMTAHTARMEAGAVHLPRQAPWLSDFRHELLTFPAGKYDDQVDALSQALDRAFKPIGATYKMCFAEGLTH